LATAETPPEVLVKATPARRGVMGMYARAAASSAPVSSATNCRTSLVLLNQHTLVSISVQSLVLNQHTLVIESVQS
jgi:hypothetical protein